MFVLAESKDAIFINNYNLKNMTQQEESESKNKLKELTMEERMIVMTYETHYQSLVKTMLQRGASTEEIDKEIQKFSHMY